MTTSQSRSPRLALLAASAAAAVAAGGLDFIVGCRHGFVAPSHNLESSSIARPQGLHTSGPPGLFSVGAEPSWTPCATAAATVAAAAAAAGVQVRKARAEARRERRGLCDRREAMLVATLGVAAASLAAEPESANAYMDDEQRIMAYSVKAKQLNLGADLYLFEVKPLVYPLIQLLTKEQCEEAGPACPDVAGMGPLRNMYTAMGSRNQVVLSRVERDILYPMRSLALDSIVDPDTADELQQLFSKFEKNQAELGQASGKPDLTLVRQKFDEGRLLINEYFMKVNNSFGIPPENQYYLTPLPGDNEALQKERFWIRRSEKWRVKQTVDAVSKGNKTARFYAKSMFGPDAVSWDERGDRAPDIYSKDSENK